MRVLESALLRLEPLVAAHADAMFEVLSDPAIYEFENAPPASPAQLRERYARLETRQSGDGTERWLNWVIRIPSGDLIGYVQATVFASHRAAIAYELNSRHWGQGHASTAVGLMAAELVDTYHVDTLSAVFKRANLRSRRLLQRNGFSPAPAALYDDWGVAEDEDLMLRTANPYLTANAAATHAREPPAPDGA